MSRITERVPLLLRAGFMLSGAMLSGAATTYASSYKNEGITAILTSVGGQMACTYVCDNSEDCGNDCKCNNSVGCVD